MQEPLSGLMGLLIGPLPFKCLRVTLSSKKLTYSQCKIMKEKVVGKVRH